MKLLKRILLFVLLILVAFLLLGMLKPKVNYGHEIIVNKPIEEAWAISQDHSKYHLWLKGFKSMTHIDGEYMAVGSKYKVIVNPGEGQPDFEMIETLRDIKENEYVTLDFESDMMDFAQTIRFAKISGGTQIKSESEVKGKNIFTKAMFAAMEMFTGSFTKQEAENFEALKKLIDG